MGRVVIIVFALVAVAFAASPAEPSKPFFTFPSDRPAGHQEWAGAVREYTSGSCNVNQNLDKRSHQCKLWCRCDEECGAKAVDATLDHKVNKIDIADCKYSDGVRALKADVATDDSKLQAKFAEIGGCDNKFCDAVKGNYTGGVCKKYNCDHQFDSDANKELVACYKLDIAAIISNVTCKAAYNIWAEDFDTNDNRDCWAQNCGSIPSAYVPTPTRAVNTLYHFNGLPCNPVKACGEMKNKYEHSVPRECPCDDPLDCALNADSMLYIGTEIDDPCADMQKDPDSELCLAEIENKIKDEIAECDQGECECKGGKWTAKAQGGPSCSYGAFVTRGDPVNYKSHANRRLSCMEEGRCSNTKKAACMQGIFSRAMVGATKCPILPYIQKCADRLGDSKIYRRQCVNKLCGDMWMPKTALRRDGQECRSVQEACGVNGDQPVIRNVITDLYQSTNKLTFQGVNKVGSLIGIQAKYYTDASTNNKQVFHHAIRKDLAEIYQTVPSMIQVLSIQKTSTLNDHLAVSYVVSEQKSTYVGEKSVVSESMNPRKDMALAMHLDRAAAVLAELVKGTTLNVPEVIKLVKFDQDHSISSTSTTQSVIYDYQNASAGQVILSLSAVVLTVLVALF